MNSPERKREYARLYYLNYEQRKLPNSESQELKLATREPQYEKNHHIRSYVICRVCGLRLKIVSHSHLARHGMTKDEYLRRFRGAPLCSREHILWMRELGERVGTAAAHRTRTMASVNGHDGEPAKRLWDYVDLHSQGRSTKEICEALRRSKTMTNEALRSVGLSTVPCFYDLGTPMTRGYAHNLLIATGLEPKAFAKVFGIRPLWTGRISSRLHARCRLDFPVARSITDARDAFIRDMSNQKGQWRWGGRNLAGVLASLFPNLHETYLLLYRVFRETSRFFETQKGIEAWQDWVCDQARREIAGALPGNLFSRFMPLAREISPFLEARLGSFCGAKRMSHLAVRALAGRLATSYVAVQRCVWVRARARRPSPPEFMQQMFLAWHFEQNRPRPVRDVPGPVPEYTKEVLRLAYSTWKRCSLLEKPKRKSWKYVGEMESVKELLPEDVQKMEPYSRGEALRRRVAELLKIDPAALEVISPGAQAGAGR